MIRLDDKVKSIVTLGSATLYPGFSFKYFGEEKAKVMVQQYADQRGQLALSEIEQCSKPSQLLN